MVIMGYSADAIWNDQKTESKEDLPVNSSMELKYLKKYRPCVNDYSSKQKGFCENGGSRYYAFKTMRECEKEV